MAGVGTHSEGVPIASLADLTFSDQYQCVCGAQIGSWRPPGSAGQSAPSSYTWPSHIAPDTIEQALAPHGLRRAYPVLAILQTHGAPSDEASPRVLLDATSLTTGGLTNLLDRREKAGSSSADPNDGRGIVVRPVASPSSTGSWRRSGASGASSSPSSRPKSANSSRCYWATVPDPRRTAVMRARGARHRAGCGRRLSTRSARGAWAPRVRSLSYGPAGGQRPLTAAFRPAPALKRGALLAGI